MKKLFRKLLRSFIAVFAIMTIVVTTAFANNSIGGGGNVIVSLWQQASSTAIKALSKYTDVWINTLCDETGSNCFDVSTGIGGAPVGATYITQTTNATLTNEQALAALATGIVKNTTTTGVLSIAAQGTDYYAPAGTDVAVADGGTGLSTFGGTNTILYTTTANNLSSSSNFTFDGSDLILYEAVNDGNPQLKLGSADAEEFHAQAVYDGGAQTLNYVEFITDVASATADKGLFKFDVDGTDILDIDDGGINFAASKGISIAGTDILTDAAGTATLSNIDVLETTTESTIEAAIDTLVNLVSVQGQTLTLAGAFITSGANSLTLTTAGATNVTLPTTGTLVNTAVTTLSSLVSVGTITTGTWNATDIGIADGGTGATLADPNADAIFTWDDSAGATVFMQVGNGLNINATPTLAADSASTTVDGVVELAIDTEVNTGTDATRAVTPDSLSGSYAGTKVLEVVLFDFATDTATGDGKFYTYIPAALTGMNLVSVHAQVITAGTTGTTNVDLARCATVASGNVCSGTVADMLSTNLTIDTGEDDSSTAAAAAVIDTANDDVATGQVIRFDVDAVHTTAAKGLIVTLEFRLP